MNFKKIYRIVFVALLALTCNFKLNGQEEEKVFIHYMGWYGEGRYGRHWINGTANQPLIGYYDSRSWSAQLFHVLLSWRCGVDGLVINLRDDYDEQCMYALLNTFKRISAVEEHFKYEFAISYDDQGLDTPSGANAKFTELRDQVLPHASNYLHYKAKPVIFIWNYPEYLDSEDYRTEADQVFVENSPLLVWNELDDAALDDVNVFYPWVQGFSEDGNEWGSGYLDWFYKTVSSKSNIDFVMGGVWAGFDERSCSWGEENRWMNRNYGQVYTDTWAFVNSYSQSLPMKWVYIETWNDWNEGTEVEPSVEHGAFYLQQTVNYINVFKDSSLKVKDADIQALAGLYEAARMIEKEERDSAVFYPMLESAIKKIISQKSDSASLFTDAIIAGISSDDSHNLQLGQRLSCFYDPVSSRLVLMNSAQEEGQVEIEVFDVQGRLLESPYKGIALRGEQYICWNREAYSSGIYLISLRSRLGRKCFRILIQD